MDANELIKKVRKIEIKSRALSQNIFAGEYHSTFKGRGMMFAEVREYQYGDDIRDIDWNVTARHNHPYVKVYEEERELTVMLLVDVSGSRDFGAVGEAKRDMIAELSATIAFSAIQNNDKIGAIFFSDKIEKFIPRRRARSISSLLSENCLTSRQSRVAPISPRRWNTLPTPSSAVAPPSSLATLLTRPTIAKLCQ